mgnify:CR=1 FL=1
MATGTLMPAPVFTGLDANGNPVAGGLLYTYAAGTTTPATTYTDVGLTVANANPVVLETAPEAERGGNTFFVAGSTRWVFNNMDDIREVLDTATGLTSSSPTTWPAPTLATVVGQLFVRASERAERIYDAMCARGWR